MKVFRDFGNRSDRKRARLKYIIHDWGLPAFCAKIEEYLGHPIADAKPVLVSEVNDHLGWQSQADGKLFLGLPVENGRIKDEGSYRLLSGLQAFFEKYRTPGRLTCQQSIILIDMEPVVAAGDRTMARGVRHRDGRADLDGASMVDGLPGAADVRPGGHRGRAPCPA